MTDAISTVRRFILDFLGTGDLVAADATAHPDIKGITGLKPMGPIMGLDEYKAIVTGLSMLFLLKIQSKSSTSSPRPTGPGS